MSGPAVITQILLPFFQVLFPLSDNTLRSFLSKRRQISRTPPSPQKKAQCHPGVRRAGEHGGLISVNEIR